MNPYECKYFFNDDDFPALEKIEKKEYFVAKLPEQLKSIEEKINYIFYSPYSIHLGSFPGRIDGDWEIMFFWKHIQEPGGQHIHSNSRILTLTLCLDDCIAYIYKIYKH